MRKPKANNILTAFAGAIAFMPHTCLKPNTGILLPIPGWEEQQQKTCSWYRSLVWIPPGEESVWSNWKTTTTCLQFKPAFFISWTQWTSYSHRNTQRIIKEKKYSTSDYFGICEDIRLQTTSFILLLLLRYRVCSQTWEWLVTLPSLMHHTMLTSYTDKSPRGDHLFLDQNIQF